MSEVPGWRYYKRTPGPIVYCHCGQYYNVPYDPGSFFQTEYASTGTSDPWAFLASGLWMPFDLLEPWCEWSYLDFGPGPYTSLEIILYGDPGWPQNDWDGWTSWAATITRTVDSNNWTFSAEQRPRFPGGLMPRDWAVAFNRAHWNGALGNPTEAEPPFNVLTFRPHQCRPGLAW